MPRLVLLAALLALVPLLAPGRSASLTIASIEDEAFSTVFIDTGSLAVAGGLYAPTPAQNPIGQLATFQDPGRVSFINNAPYYLVNPTAWAFSGAGRADVVFSQAMSSVSIAVRGTAAGESSGSASAFPFPGSTPLSESDGIVALLDALGGIIPGTETPIQNLDLKGAAIAEIAFDAAGVGQAIHGIALIQRASGDDVGLFLGGLGITPAAAPEPGLAVGLGAILLAILRRRAA